MQLHLMLYLFINAYAIALNALPVNRYNAIALNMSYLYINAYPIALNALPAYKCIYVCNCTQSQLIFQGKTKQQFI